MLIKTSSLQGHVVIGRAESKIFWSKGETTLWYGLLMSTKNGYRQHTHTHLPHSLLRRANIIYETLEPRFPASPEFPATGGKREILSDFDGSQGGHLTRRGPVLFRLGFAGRQWVIELIERSNGGERIQGGHAPASWGGDWEMWEELPEDYPQTTCFPPQCMLNACMNSHDWFAFIWKKYESKIWFTFQILVYWWWSL